MITRAIVMKDAVTTGTTCSCSGLGLACGIGAIVSLGGRACDVILYGGLEILSSTASGVKVFLQANSSSGYLAGATCNNPGTDVVAFTSRGCRDSQFVRLPWNCASATSTHRTWYRLAWVQTCAQTNKFLGAMSVE